ncbi:MAG: hypothetical protein ACYTFW_03860 [Planctomycetota bacterium]|jgi:hypothetical protein
MIEHNFKNKANFKRAKMNVSIYNKENYEKNTRLRSSKNKAKQTCPEQRRMEPISE